MTRPRTNGRFYVVLDGGGRLLNTRSGGFDPQDQFSPFKHLFTRRTSAEAAGFVRGSKLRVREVTVGMCLLPEVE